MRTELALAIMSNGNASLVPSDAMYLARVHTCAFGGLDCIIAAGSVIECLRAKAYFDYARDDAFDYCWITRWDGKNIDAPPAAMRRMAEEAMAEEKEERPEFITDEDEKLYLGFLDDLRESGVTNMQRATPYLLDEFSELSKDQAKQVLYYWMRSFSERH